jgi:hypothetical protein
MSSKVEIVQYSDKAIAVFGDTKPYVNELKELGGKFNPSLTHENEKKPGWIYPKKVSDKLQELVTKINAGVVKPSESVKSYATEKINSVDIKVFMALVSRVERLEQEIKLLQDKQGILSSASVTYKSKKEQVDIDSGSDCEDVEIERPRLIKGKK